MINRRKPRKRRLPFAIGAVVIVAIVAVVFFWASAGNKATITPASASKAPTRVSDKAYDGKYMTFTYSGQYLAHQKDAKDDDLEIAKLTADTDYTKFLVVTVSKLPDGNLNNNSTYLLRMSQPSTYSSRQATADGQAITVWVKHDNSEQTAIIPRGDKVAILSFNTANTNADQNLQPEVDSLLQTFHWK